jgi:hypothetical protein
VAIPTVAALARDARARRNLYLNASDWVVVRALELEEAVPEEWATYRQALRDVTEQESFPLTVVWPDPPA